MNAEEKEFTQHYENFSRMVGACGKYMSQPSAERESCLNRLMEAAFWFRAYWDFLHPPNVEGIQAVTKEKSTGKIVGVSNYGTKEKDQKPN